MASEHSSETESPAHTGVPERPVTGRRLLRSTSVVSSMTLLSRILGLVRDVVFARFFGATIVMDAFIVANRIPNMLRRFFAEGAFSQGFVPVMARYREKHGHDEAREFVDSIAGTLGLILFLVTLAGVIAAPILVAVVAPGFIGEDGRFDRFQRHALEHIKLIQHRLDLVGMGGREGMAQHRMNECAE